MSYPAWAERLVNIGEPDMQDTAGEAGTNS